MKAHFDADGAEIEIDTETDRVIDGNTFQVTGLTIRRGQLGLKVALKRSEARAIASALMGAAAEL